MELRNPQSEREQWKEILPAWVVDNLLAPFADEVGRGVVLFRCVLDGLILGYLLLLFLPPKVLLSCALWGLCTVGVLWHVTRRMNL